MRSIRMLFCLLTAVVIIIVAGCSDKGTGGGDSDPTAAGTWALTLIQAITASDTTDTVIVADSSRKYVVVSGTNVTLYEYDGPGTGNPALRSGTYSTAPAQFVFSHITYAMSFTATSLVLSTTTEILTFSRYTGTVPPAFWPTGSMTVDDDSYEPDDDRTTATLIGTGTSQTHTIDDNDEDWFGLQVTSGMIYTVTFSGASSGYDIQVYDAAGNQLWDFLENQVSVDEDNGTVTVTPLASGIFYLRVRINEAVAYTVSVSSATVPPSPYSGTWYMTSQTFSITQGGVTQSQTEDYTVSNTPSIAVFQGNLLIFHDLDDSTYTIDTMVFVYINSTTAIVSGDTVKLTQTGSTITVEFESDWGSEGVMKMSMTYMTYSGPVPPADWPPETSWGKIGVMKTAAELPVNSWRMSRQARLPAVLSKPD